MLTQFHGDAAVGQIDGISRSTQHTHLNVIDDISEDNFPVVNLEEHATPLGQARLTGLGAIPLDFILQSDGDRPDDHLRRSGQHVRTVRYMGQGRFRRLRDVAEGLDVDHIDRHIRIHRFRASNETVHIEFCITDFDGSDHTDHTAHGLSGGDRTVDVTALIRCRGVGVDVIQTKGVLVGAPGERSFRELWRQIDQNRAELRTMGDDEIIITGEGPISQCDGGIIDDEGSFLENELKIILTHLFLDGQQGIVHALAEGEVIRSAGRHGRYTKWLILSQSGRQRERENREHYQQRTPQFAFHFILLTHSADRTKSTCRFGCITRPVRMVLSGQWVSPFVSRRKPGR